MVKEIEGKRINTIKVVLTKIATFRSLIYLVVEINITKKNLNVTQIISRKKLEIEVISIIVK